MCSIRLKTFSAFIINIFLENLQNSIFIAVWVICIFFILLCPSKLCIFPHVKDIWYKVLSFLGDRCAFLCAMCRVNVKFSSSISPSQSDISYWNLTLRFILALLLRVLFWWGGHCCPMQIYCAPPNLGITRTWICRLNFARRPIFSGLRFFNEPEILDPPGGLVLRIFTSWENPSTSAGFEPTDLGSRTKWRLSELCRCIDSPRWTLLGTIQ